MHGNTLKGFWGRGPTARAETTQRGGRKPQVHTRLDAAQLGRHLLHPGRVWGQPKPSRSSRTNLIAGKASAAHYVRAKLGFKSIFEVDLPFIVVAFWATRVRICSVSVCAIVFQLFQLFQLFHNHCLHCRARPGLALLTVRNCSPVRSLADSPCA